MAKTSEEIEKLKTNWRKDPCWDIEDTEGFEEHKEELIAYRKEVGVETDKRVAAWAEIRIEQMQAQTGITDRASALSLFTFSEIENDIKRANTGDTPARFDGALADIAQAHARATLLLAAQVKRVADALENMDGRDNFEETVRIWGSGK